MKTFKSDENPDFEYKQAIKKRIPIRCYQIHESFKVESDEGTFDGKPGDYLMIGVKNEMYICPKDVFEETYEINEGTFWAI